MQRLGPLLTADDNRRRMDMYFYRDRTSDALRIAGYLGFYASHFDRVLLDGQNIASAADKAADSAMIASPTIDSVMRERA